MEDYGALIQIGIFCLLVVVGFFSGSWAEKRHYASIRKREEELRHILLVPVRRAPTKSPCKAAFVCGSVVIGMDYFKMTLAAFVNILGGRIGAYETLVERARREAILRMKEQAAALNGRYIFNVKFSTANLRGQQNQQSGCVEVVAYGTALSPARPDPKTSSTGSASA